MTVCDTYAQQPGLGPSDPLVGRAAFRNLLEGRGSEVSLTEGGAPAALQAPGWGLRPRPGKAVVSQLLTSISGLLASPVLTWPLCRLPWEGLQQDESCERPVTCQYLASKIESSAAKSLIQCVPIAVRCGDNYDLTGPEL